MKKATEVKHREGIELNKETTPDAESHIQELHSRIQETQQMINGLEEGIRRQEESQQEEEAGSTEIKGIDEDLKNLRHEPELQVSALGELKQELREALQKKYSEFSSVLLTLSGKYAVQGIYGKSPFLPAFAAPFTEALADSHETLRTLAHNKLAGEGVTQEQPTYAERMNKVLSDIAWSVFEGSRSDLVIDPVMLGVELAEKNSFIPVAEKIQNRRESLEAKQNSFMSIIKNCLKRGMSLNQEKILTGNINPDDIDFDKVIHEVTTSNNSQAITIAAGDIRFETRNQMGLELARTRDPARDSHTSELEKRLATDPIIKRLKNLSPESVQGAFDLLTQRYPKTRLTVSREVFSRIKEALLAASTEKTQLDDEEKKITKYIPLD